MQLLGSNGLKQTAFQAFQLWTQSINLCKNQLMPSIRYCFYIFQLIFVFSLSLYLHFLSVLIAACSQPMRSYVHRNDPLLLSDIVVMVTFHQGNVM